MHRVTTAAAMAVALFGSAYAQDMFNNVQTIASDDGGPDIITFDGLSRDVMQMTPGETINLNFGPGYVAELDRLDTQALGARVWVGRLEGGTLNDRILITETNGYTFGRFVTDEGIWHIIPEGGSHRLVRQSEDWVVPRQRPDYVVLDPMELARLAEMAPDLSQMPEIADAVPIGSNGIIDVAIFYSQSMSAQWGLATGGRIQYIMSVLDQAMMDSDTGLRARLVHLDSVNLTTDNADQGDTLNNLLGQSQPGDNNYQDLSALRAAGVTFGADLVAIIQGALNGQGSCGVAPLLGGGNDTIGPQDVSGGYSINADWIADVGNGQFSYCDAATLAHEIGHNMGFAHNVEDAGGTPGEGVRDYAHGHRVDCDFGTIMSYTSAANTTCPQGSPRAAQGEMTVYYFSDPSINLCPNNVPCGIAAPDQPGIDSPLTNDPADNARAAREESLNIVNFRPVAPRVVSSVLPITRSVQNGSPATAFATIINPAATQSEATSCGLRLAGATAGEFSYQTTDAQNQLTGTPNTPVNIAAGGAQNFLFTVTSAADFSDNSQANPLGRISVNDETHLFVEAFCTNRRSAEYTLGLNSLIFSSWPNAVPDIVALAASGDPGRVNVPTTGNMVGAFAVAISNVGAAGTIDVSADTGGRTLAIQNIEVCPTDPGTGACTAARAATAQVNVGANGTGTFAVFVRGNGQAIANDPARNRVFVRFNEGGTPRGATSVAVRTQ